MPSILDKLRWRIAASDEEPEVEEAEERAPNPLEEAVLAGSGVEVGELAEKIAAGRGVDLAISARGIYRALEDGKVRLVDPNPPTSVAGFLSPVYSGWLSLIVAFCLLVIYSIYLMPQIYPLIYLRYAVGAIFVLYVPGYTLIEALYPKRDELERLERFALGIGLSLALVPLVGLILNYTPWGIRLDPILISLIILTLILSGVAIMRKYGYWKLSNK